MIPVYTGSPNAGGAVYGGFNNTTASTGPASKSGLGVLYEYRYMTTSRVAYCAAEVAWSESRFTSGEWWPSVANNLHQREWREMPDSRWNSSFMYRWGTPNPYGFVTPWFPNLQSVEGQRYAMRSAMLRGFGNKGLLTENMMDNGLSPANARGTIHRGGGNALFYDGSVKFLGTLKNIYNPGGGPYGYSLGFLVFMDQIDGK